MRLINRDIPEGIVENCILKNIAFNSKGNLFLIFAYQSEKPQEEPKKNKKELHFSHENFKERELLISLNENETKEIIKFLGKIEL